MNRSMIWLLSLPLATTTVAPVAGAPVRGLTRVGQCAMTKVKWVGQRLEDKGQPVPDSGSSIALANGVYGVDYDQVPAINTSRVGDPVRACLVSIPRGCPRGDTRGREYKGTNLRTSQSWTLPDAEHQCGGA